MAIWHLGAIVIIKTRIFELCNQRYGNLSELARAMEISVSQIYRVREGKRSINQIFLIGAVKAFPEYKLDDLFYLTDELTTGTTNYNQGSADEQAAREKQGMERTHQALERFASAIDEYAQHLKSHTSAIISLREASQEMKKGAEEANKVLSHLYGSSVN